MKKNLFRFLILAVLGVGAYFGMKSALTWDTSLKVEQQSNVLLERVKTVCKLVTVEGEFSDVYSHKDYYWQDIGLFRKKALVKVKAKVAVGYDLSKYEFEMLPEEKRMIIKKNAGPEVLYIDTDISYYDLTEGTFNSFKPAELTAINKKAKEHIQKKAMSGTLFDAAEKQATQIDDLIGVMAKQAGWTVEYQAKKPDELLN